LVYLCRFDASVDADRTQLQWRKAALDHKARTVMSRRYFDNDDDIRLCGFRALGRFAPEQIGKSCS